MARLYQLPLGAWVVILVAVLSVPAVAQVEVEDFGYQNKAIEPGDAVPMDNTVRPAALGSGVTVMRFEIRDVDPQADDPSDVRLHEFVIHNLGTADEADIAEILCMDEDGNAVAPLATPSVGPNDNIPFEAVCDLDGFVIPDGESEEFQIAVRTVGTNQLTDDDQNNTVQLRVTVRYDETVGSPPTTTSFNAELTDAGPEAIYNGGINDVLDETYGTESLMPGEQGVVSRFTVCDDDSNEHNLVIDQITIKQGDDGTALFTDLTSIELFRIENNARTQVGVLTPEVSSDRGGVGDSILLPTDVFLQDDRCTTLEVEAQVSPFAFMGKLIQFEYQISVAEPVNFDVDPNVDPELRTMQPTAIGNGLIRIADSVILPERADGERVTTTIPIEVSGFALPGFGALQVGPNGALTFNPDVVRVLNVVSAHPDMYRIDVVDIDNRLGQLRFTIRATQDLLERMTDSNADPEDLPFRNGTIAFVEVQGIGDPGEQTRMNLRVDDVKDANNHIVTDGIGIDAGLVEIVPPGDVNRDGTVTINDSLLLAQELTLSCANLTDTQKRIADVANPQAPDDEIPQCTGPGATIDSADVAEIARRAMDPDTNGASASPTTATDDARVTPLSVHHIQTTLANGTLSVAASGEGIRSLQVDLFNLAGDRVIHDRALGRQLQVRLQTDTGQPLANGVYLYRVTVEGVNGQVVRSEIRKLIVLR